MFDANMGLGHANVGFVDVAFFGNRSTKVSTDKVSKPVLVQFGDLR